MNSGTPTSVALPDRSSFGMTMSTRTRTVAYSCAVKNVGLKRVPGFAAARAAAKPGTLFKPTFFTAHEYATVRVLVDIVMPKDERSGSATDVGVPEFMDLIVNDQPARKVT